MRSLFFLGRGAGPPQRPPWWLFASLLLLGGCPEEKPAPTVWVGEEDTGPWPGGCGEEDGDGYCIGEGDCDDSNVEVNPAATEICDGIDNNCDEVVDEGVEGTYYLDADGDGFGDPAETAIACEAPRGYVQNGADCDDGSPDAYPGNLEVCDGRDNNCDGVVDEGVLSTWHLDMDFDGYGDPSMSVDACEGPGNSTTDATDCDDTDATAYPGATEICDGVDDDCDGTVDDDAADAPTWYLDYDADGYGGDTLTAAGCAAPTGYAATNDDCDDTSPDVSPGATETCDGVDEDCDGAIDDGVAFTDWYTDADGDGHGDPATARSACVGDADEIASGDDCDDTSADVSPSATETCDGVDEDCNGSIDDGGVCACDVVEYGGHAYQLCLDSLNWYEAADACVADGYLLATIDDAAEDAFLRAEVAGWGAGYSWWMGYSDLASEGTWEWEDGSAATYTNWNSGEPNDLFGEDCATFAYGGTAWNDWACTNSTSYLCESL